MILLKEYAILVVIYYKTPSSLQREAYVDFWYFSQMALVETFEWSVISNSFSAGREFCPSIGFVMFKDSQINTPGFQKLKNKFVWETDDSK